MLAFRYALGRETYIVGLVCDELIAQRHLLTEDWKEQIIRDINDAISFGQAGQACDRIKWKKLAEVLDA